MKSGVWDWLVKYEKVMKRWSDGTVRGGEIVGDTKREFEIQWLLGR